MLNVATKIKLLDPVQFEIQVLLLQFFVGKICYIEPQQFGVHLNYTCSLGDRLIDFKKDYTSVGVTSCSVSYGIMVHWLEQSHQIRRDLFCTEFA